MPRTKHWRAVVNSIAPASLDPAVTAVVANQTLDNVSRRLIDIEHDSGVIAAFEYLVALSTITRNVDYEIRVENLPELEGDISNIRIAALANQWVNANANSKEYSAIAKQALADTIARWNSSSAYANNLFDDSYTIHERWQEASTTGGFSEVSRLFFARFTERYLNYFLEREASATIPALDVRDAFKRNLHNKIDEVSKHAWDTSKIAQSFAAGWYMNNATKAFPKKYQIRRFLRIAFSKIREELRREALI